MGEQTAGEGPRGSAFSGQPGQRQRKQEECEKSLRRQGTEIGERAVQRPVFGRTYGATAGMCDSNK